MADSAHEEILDLVGARLATLTGLEGAEGRIHRRAILSQEWANGLGYFPCVAFGAVGIQTIGGELTGSDDHGYPVTVRWVDRLNGAMTAAGERRWLKARKAIFDAFDHKPLGDPPTLVHSEAVFGYYQAGPMVEEEPAAFEFFVSPLVFAFISRELR